jgi:hypothetical protein
MRESLRNTTLGKGTSCGVACTNRFAACGLTCALALTDAQQDLGIEAFTVLASYLALAHAVSPVEDQISIPRLQSDGLIGMSDAPFEVLRLLAERFGRSELCVQESTFTSPLSVWQRLIARAIQGPTLVEREGLLSVIENVLKRTEAGYPDNPADDPATFDTEFILARKRGAYRLPSSPAAGGP